MPRLKPAVFSAALLVGVLVTGFGLRRAESFTASVTIPVICKQGCQTLDVTKAGAVPNDGRDDAPALNRLLDQHPRNTVFVFPNGTYDLASALRHDRLENVVFSGAPSATLKKMPGFKDEYLLYSRFSRNVRIAGLTFRGLTTDRTAYHWGESGVYLASSNGALIENNRFYDFGDAAIRITTSMAGPKGVASANSTVRNNYFDNIAQITTTSNANNYGGSAGYYLTNNEFRNLKGSVKFASRTAGAAQVIIENNRIYGSPHVATSDGIEAVSYSNMFIQNNLIANCGSFGMNIYTNPGPGIEGFDWGNLEIRNNTITGCPRGIRVSTDAYRTGYMPRVDGITISDNTLRVAAPNPLQLVHGAERIVTAKNNH